jgi:hypothetical protein
MKILKGNVSISQYNRMARDLKILYKEKALLLSKTKIIKKKIQQEKA